jgi:DNA-binding response OmpR family regulator
VVEDEPLVAIEIAHILKKAGFDVIDPARSVAPALSLIEERGCDAAVLDINLGGETSEPVAWRLLTRGAPFVALSGYSGTQHPPVFSGAPALAKPVRPELLVAELRRCLKQGGDKGRVGSNQLPCGSHPPWLIAASPMRSWRRVTVGTAARLRTMSPHDGSPGRSFGAHAGDEKLQKA